MQECDGYEEWIPTLEKFGVQQLSSQMPPKVNMIKIAVYLLMLQFSIKTHQHIF